MDPINKIKDVYKFCNIECRKVKLYWLLDSRQFEWRNIFLENFVFFLLTNLNSISACVLIKTDYVTRILIKIMFDCIDFGRKMFWFLILLTIQKNVFFDTFPKKKKESCACVFKLQHFLSNFLFRLKILKVFLVHKFDNRIYFPLYKFCGKFAAETSFCVVG